MVNDKGMQKMPVCNSKSVGPQGAGGSGLVNGGAVGGVSNPRGISPKTIGGGIDMVQPPIQPTVGK